MIEQLFNKIQGLARENTLDVEKQGNYTKKGIKLVYHDSRGQYEEISEIKNTDTVTSASALVDFIKEECRRRENITGDKATLQLSLIGGSFYADTDFNYGICKYARKFSQQWEMLQNYANKFILFTF